VQSYDELEQECLHLHTALFDLAIRHTPKKFIVNGDIVVVKLMPDGDPLLEHAYEVLEASTEDTVAIAKGHWDKWGLEG
jgi:hypothetical protein